MTDVGLIGCGGIGTMHCLALRELYKTHGVRVTALADCRPQALQKAAAYWPGASCHASGMSLLENESLTAAHICLPSHLHADHAVKAMERGLHVFIEKPVCLSLEDGRRLLAAQRRHGAKVLVGQVLRFFREYDYVKEVYDSNALGRLKWITLRRLSGDVTWGFEDWFHDEKKSGSVVLDLHVHDVDFLRYMLGEPDMVDATGLSDKNGMVTHVLSQYRFGRVFATAEGLWDVSGAFPFEASFRAHFEDGTVVYNSGRTPPLVVYRRDGTSFAPQLPEELEGTADAGINLSDIGPYYAEIKYFVECMQNGVQPARASLAEGVGSVRLALRELALVKAHQQQATY